MRAAIIFIFLFFQLLGFGSINKAVSRDSSCAANAQYAIKNKIQNQVVQGVPNTIAIFIAEFDLEEDLSNNENFKSASASISNVKNFLKQFWLSQFSSQLLVSIFNSQTKFRTPVCVQSCPIYIFQQVLRI